MPGIPVSESRKHIQLKLFLKENKTNLLFQCSAECDYFFSFDSLANLKKVNGIIYCPYDKRPIGTNSSNKTYVYHLIFDKITLEKLLLDTHSLINFSYKQGYFYQSWLVDGKRPFSLNVSMKSAYLLT